MRRCASAPPRLRRPRLTTRSPEGYFRQGLGLGPSDEVGDDDGPLPRAVDATLVYGVGIEQKAAALIFQPFA